MMRRETWEGWGEGGAAASEGRRVDLLARAAAPACREAEVVEDAFTAALTATAQGLEAEVGRPLRDALAALHEARRRERQLRARHQRTPLALATRERLGERLRARGLPVLLSVDDLREVLALEPGSWPRQLGAELVTRQPRYARFAVPKRAGGERVIAAPDERLKQAQRRAARVFEALPVHPAAHAFRAARSTVSNARPHVGAAVVVNVDLADFFPSITARRVQGLLGSLGYPEGVAAALTTLCTEPALARLELADPGGGAPVGWWVAQGARRLPQGAPSSPAISNSVCLRLDRALQRVAARLGFRYTRYVDDLTFSSGAEDAPVGALLGRVTRRVQDEGFSLRADKTQVARRGQRQRVTGLDVTHHVGVPRRLVRRFKAVLFQVERDGPVGKRWGDDEGPLLEQLRGFADYVGMVQPAQGARLRARVDALRERFG